MEWNLEEMSREERNAFLIAAFRWIAANPELPTDVFFAKLAALPTPFYEMIELSNHGGEHLILLDRRPTSDPFYAGRLATQGGPIFFQETSLDTKRRHSERETALPVSLWNVPNWRFCGVVNAPHTHRQHGVINVFARMWSRLPVSRSGEWYPLNAIKRDDMVPSNCEMAQLAIDVIMGGYPPDYREYLGTDE